MAARIDQLRNTLITRFEELMALAVVCTRCFGFILFYLFLMGSDGMGGRVRDRVSNGIGDRVSDKSSDGMGDELSDNAELWANLNRVGQVKNTDRNTTATTQYQMQVEQAALVSSLFSSLFYSFTLYHVSLHGLCLNC